MANLYRVGGDNITIIGPDRSKIAPKKEDYKKKQSEKQTSSSKTPSCFAGICNRLNKYKIQKNTEANNKDISEDQKMIKIREIALRYAPEVYTNEYNKRIAKMQHIFKNVSSYYKAGELQDENINEFAKALDVMHESDHSHWGEVDLENIIQNIVNKKEKQIYTDRKEERLIKSLINMLKRNLLGENFYFLAGMDVTGEMFKNAVLGEYCPFDPIIIKGSKIVNPFAAFDFIEYRSKEDLPPLCDKICSLIIDLEESLNKIKDHEDKKNFKETKINELSNSEEQMYKDIAFLWDNDVIKNVDDARYLFTDGKFKGGSIFFHPKAELVREIYSLSSPKTEIDKPLPPAAFITEIK